MVLKATEYYLTNLAKNSQVKVGKTTCRSCISRHDYFMFTVGLLPEILLYCA